MCNAEAIMELELEVDDRNSLELKFKRSGLQT